MKKNKVKDILRMAYEQRYAVPAINVSNLETVTGVLSAASRLDKPVILQIAPIQKEAQGYTYDLIVKIIDTIAETFEKGSYGIHLDHATEFKDCKEAIESGFESIMFDGTDLSYTENIRETQKVRAFIQDATLEGELGVIGGSEGEAQGSTQKIYTDPEVVGEFIDKTGVDILGISIGNAHGVYKGAPHLELTILERINEKRNIPLVLHGASGIPYELLEKAIHRGISKINFFTEVDRVFNEAFVKSYEQGNYMMHNVRSAQDKVEAKVIEIINICG